MTGTWPTGWATGDIEQAAEFKKGIGAISDTTLGGSAANIDITSISATYAHLLIVAYARSDSASGVAINHLVQFNGDTAANYDWQKLQGSAAAVSAGEVFASTSLAIGLMPTNPAGANLFSVHMAFIPHYAGTTNNKVCLSINSMKFGVTTGSMAVGLNGGFWRSSAAINRITLLPASGSFVAGTRITIYGLGA